MSPFVWQTILEQYFTGMDEQNFFYECLLAQGVGSELQEEMSALLLVCIQSGKVKESHMCGSPMSFDLTPSGE